MGDTSKLVPRRGTPVRALALIAALTIGCHGSIPSGSAAVESMPAGATGGASPSPDVSPPMPTTAPTATPGSDPTYQPDPTPDNAYPLRTEVEIHVGSARPGVPADVRDMFWWTYYSDAGRIGSTAHMGLPGNEKAVTVGGGIVVSARPVPDYGDVEALVIRDFATGAVVREIAVSMDWPNAAVVDGRVFWTGMSWDEADHETTADAGVWSAKIEGTDQPQAIVEPGKIIGSAISGRRIEVSPSGRTIAAITSSLGGELWTDIIDVESRTRVGRIQDTSIDTLTDDLYVVSDQPPTDAPMPGHGITARDLRTGEVLWRFPDPGDADHFTLRDMKAFGSIVILEYLWDQGHDLADIIGVIDASTGEHRLLLRQAWVPGEDPLAADLTVSTSAHLLLASDYRIGYALDDGRARISVLDVASGRLEPNAFVIELPSHCDYEYCYRP
jgi:hypothetical protein